MLFYSYSNIERQVQEIAPEYVDEVKAKVADVFGAKSRDRVYNQIEDLLRDKKMVGQEKYLSKIYTST